MAGLMGGRVAEEEVFGEPSTGASNDLQQATGLARMMVRDYGMSADARPRVARRRARPELPRDEGAREPHATRSRRRSRWTARSRRWSSRRRSGRASCCGVHREKLDAMAARLLAAEVVEEEEIARLWGPKVDAPGDHRGARPRRGAPGEPEPARGDVRGTRGVASRRRCGGDRGERGASE